MKGNKTYSERNQNRLRAYLEKQERNDIKPTDRQNTSAGERPRNDRNGLERSRNGSTGHR